MRESWLSSRKHQGLRMEPPQSRAPPPFPGLQPVCMQMEEGQRIYSLMAKGKQSGSVSTRRVLGIQTPMQLMTMLINAHSEKRGRPGRSGLCFCPRGQSLLQSRRLRIQSRASKGGPLIQSRASKGGLQIQSRASKGGLQIQSRASKGGLLIQSRASKGGLLMQSQASKGGSLIQSRTSKGGLLMQSRASKGGPLIQSRASKGGLLIQSRASKGGLLIQSPASKGRLLIQSWASKQGLLIQSRASKGGLLIQSRASKGGLQIQSWGPSLDWKLTQPSITSWGNRHESQGRPKYPKINSFQPSLNASHTQDKPFKNSMRK